MVREHSTSPYVTAQGKPTSEIGIDYNIHPLHQYYLSSPKLLYRSGELGLVKNKPIELHKKRVEEELPYIVSVSPTSKM